MREYTAYIKSLDSLLERTAWVKGVVDPDSFDLHLNGDAATALRRLVPSERLRNSGAFFTGKALGRMMIEMIPSTNATDIPAWDPNCGAGDLLLRWSERLDVIGSDLEATLSSWSDKLLGVDIHPEFLQVAKRRLTLAAVSRGARIKHGRLQDLDSLFPGLECRNCLDRNLTAPKSAVILMNPPFTTIETPSGCSDWSSGKVTFAAVALLNCLRSAQQGQQILAILPDVLRSGTRYQRWRKLVAQHTSSAKVHIVGRFDEHVDVDVFILQVTASYMSPIDILWFPAAKKSGVQVIGDICEVRVGSVVPHRHKHRGPKVAYVTTSTAPRWNEIDSLTTTIRHEGTCVVGPFLAVRRTSGPMDSSRAIATVVNIHKRVAVENHLITLRPFDGTAETCRRIQSHLRSKPIRQWLDQRIRCRHLTVSALKEIPWQDN